MTFRLFVISVLILVNNKVYSQEKNQISLIGSLQIIDNQSLSLGVELRGKVKRPVLDFDGYFENKIRGMVFSGTLNFKKVYGFRNTFYWSNKYAGIGIDSRYLFQGNRNKIDIGPSVKFGYKYFWLEYSMNFLIGKNMLTSNPGIPNKDIEFNNTSNNLTLTLSIPINRINK